MVGGKYWYYNRVTNDDRKNIEPLVEKKKMNTDGNATVVYHIIIERPICNAVNLT